MKNPMKTVLIFGVGGFVGRYLTKEMVAAGYTVDGSDIMEHVSWEGLSGYTPADLTDAEAVEAVIQRVKPDYIVNLAAISSAGLSWKFPQMTMDINVNGCLNILESVRKINGSIRILLIGSSEEYAQSKKPVNEEWETLANNPYGISKAAMELFAKTYRNAYGLDIRMTRSFNHTGTGQKDSFVIPSWCKQAAEISASGKAGVMHVGNLAVKRDFSDVRDIVRAYRLILEQEEKNRTYNVGSGQAYALREILEHIVKLSAAPIEIRVDEDRIRPNDNPYICCDHSKITRELGWEPEYTIWDAVDGMFQEYVRAEK